MLFIESEYFSSIRNALLSHLIDYKGINSLPFNLMLLAQTRISKKN